MQMTLLLPPTISSDVPPRKIFVKAITSEITYSQQLKGTWHWRPRSRTVPVVGSSPATYSYFIIGWQKHRHTDAELQSSDYVL
jgi:hypothetical protein